MLCSSVWVLSWEEPAWLGAVLAFSGRVFGAERSLDLLFPSCSVADIPRLKGWPVWNKEPHLTNRYTDKRYSSSWLDRAICDQEDTFLQQLGATWLPGRSSGSNHVRHQPWWVSWKEHWTRNDLGCLVSPPGFSAFFLVCFVLEKKGKVDWVFVVTRNTGNMFVFLFHGTRYFLGDSAETQGSKQRLRCGLCLPLREKEMATHSSILAWRIPGTEEAGGLLSIGSQSWTWLKQLSMHACLGEGNGNPLQNSCLENPWDRGAWWAAIYGVSQSQTWLKRLSSSSSMPPPTRVPIPATELPLASMLYTRLLSEISFWQRILLHANIKNH